MVTTFFEKILMDWNLHINNVCICAFKNAVEDRMMSCYIACFPSRDKKVFLQPISFLYHLNELYKALKKDWLRPSTFGLNC